MFEYQFLEAWSITVLVDVVFKMSNCLSRLPSLEHNLADFIIDVTGDRFYF